MESLLPGCTPFPAALAESYRAAGYWRGETLWDLLVDSARVHGDKSALVSAGEHTSYRALHERAESLAAGLFELGIRAGDRVVVQLPNVPALFETLFALFRLGALPVLALPAHRELELVGFCQQASAVAYVIADRHAGYDYRALARRVRSRVSSLRHVLVMGEPEEWTALSSLNSQVELPSAPRAHEVALFQLSGGSTGTPKLIPRTHDDYVYSVRVAAEVCRLDSRSVYLVALPAVHNFPLSSPGALGTLLVGGTVVLAKSPAPDEVFPLIARERVSITALVPPLLLVWLEARAQRDDDLSSLQVVQVGGAKLLPELARRVRPTLGCQLQQVFGMAEGLVCYTRLDDAEELVLTTQGRPASEADEVQVLDDDDRPVAAGATGHLLTRGPYTVRGYYAAEEHNRRAFTADGFYRTGDLVSRLPSGHLIVQGREKDQINRGGEKIAAAEVESLLLTHPQVHDVALVAMPDPLLGERSCAFVASRGARPSQGELNRMLRERGLAAFKIPDRYEFLEHLPETSVGKVDKKQLRQLIAEKRAAQPSL